MARSSPRQRYGSGLSSHGVGMELLTAVTSPLAVAALATQESATGEASKEVAKGLSDALGAVIVQHPYCVLMSIVFLVALWIAIHYFVKFKAEHARVQQPMISEHLVHRILDNLEGQREQRDRRSHVLIHGKRIVGAKKLPRH